MPLDEWFDRCGGLAHIEGNLWRSPLPYTRAHVDAVHAAGIRVVYSMEHAAPGPLFLQRGLDWRPHFWTDDQPPRPEQMRRFLDDHLALPHDTPTLVHCKAGWGRTGSAIACALIVERDWSAQRALDHFWQRVPPAREVMEWNGQAEFVRGFAARLRGRDIEGAAREL